MPTQTESADFQGEIQAFGTISIAYLFADENRLYLRALLARYQFVPSEVVALEESGDRGVIVKHIRPDYPEKIVFNSSNNSATEILSAIATKGFIPCATTNDIPTREGFPIRAEILGIAYLLLNILFFLTLIVGIVIAIFKIDYPPVEVGSWTGIVSLSTILTAFTFMRFFQPVHWLLLKPGRYMSELSPGIDILMILLGLLFVANFLVYLGIPEIVAVGIDFLVLWAIVQLDMRLFS